MDAANQVAAKAVNPADSQMEESKATARMQAVAAGRKEVDAQAEGTVNAVGANLPPNLLQGASSKDSPLLSQILFTKERLRGFWWSRGGSNSWPPHCERGALPTELLPHARQNTVSSFEFQV